MKSKKDFIKKISISNSLFNEVKKNFDIKKLKNFSSSLQKNKKFYKFIKNCEKKIQIDSIKGVIISFTPKKNLTINSRLMTEITEATSKILGEMLVQNSNNEKMIFVFDRDRDFSIKTGSRYHQTREGGSIHTDNVNISYKWDYMILSCLSNAEVGGENIFVNANTVYKELKKYTSALSILKKKFLWERRGVSETFYKAPVLSFNKNKQPQFRYLRPYMISAYEKQKKEMSLKQKYALDVLDAILESSENQQRFYLNNGDLLLVKDSEIFHGRTSFSDYLGAKEIFKGKIKKDKIKRTMIRTWIKK